MGKALGLALGLCVAAGVALAGEPLSRADMDQRFEKWCIEAGEVPFKCGCLTREMHVREVKDEEMGVLLFQFGLMPLEAVPGVAERGYTRVERERLEHLFEAAMAHCRL